MPPVSQLAHRPVYRDPQDSFTVSVSHVVVAAALVALGHPLEHIAVVSGGRPDLKRSRFIFNRSARADFERLQRLIDEMDARRERAYQRPSSVRA
jgi:hypothetical protein